MLDQATARPEDLAHLRDCPHCAERVAGLKRVIGIAEKLRGRVPPEVAAHFQAKMQEAIEKSGASGAEAANAEAMLARLFGSAAPAPAAGGAPGTMPAAPAPFDPPEPAVAPQGRRSRRDDAIEHIAMPSQARESIGLPPPYEAEASTGLLERLGLRGPRLVALLLALLAMAIAIAFLLRRLG